MKAKEKLLTLVTGGALLIIILTPTISNAALQANGNGSSTKSIDGWMSSIRAMEAQGGTLGLNGSSSLNQVPGADGKVENSNNLDIHMQKNTEYGAMVILSASNYGKSTPVHKTDDGSLSTTTGNKSGVYMSLNKEWVAAGGSLGNTSTYKNANLKYRNPYTKNGKEKRAGDAMLECSGWHNTGNAVATTWINGDSNTGVVRSYSGSIFSFYADGYTSTRDADCRKLWSSRAVVVIGNGI